MTEAVQTLKRQRVRMILVNLAYFMVLLLLGVLLFLQNDLRGSNRLDDSEKLLGIGYISQSFFAIRSGHFQLVTSCNRFISLILQAFLRYLPVVTSCLIIWLISQHSYHINDGKVPFFLFLIPCGSNTLVFEQLDIIALCHLNHLVLS